MLLSALVILTFLASGHPAEAQVVPGYPPVFRQMMPMHQGPPSQP